MLSTHANDSPHSRCLRKQELVTDKFVDHIFCQFSGVPQRLPKLRCSKKKFGPYIRGEWMVRDSIVMVF